MIRVYKLTNPDLENLIIRGVISYRNTNIQGSYALSEVDEGLKIDMSLKSYINKDYSLVLKYSDYAGKIVQLRVMDTYKKMELKPMLIFDKVNDKSFLSNEAVAFPDVNVARIVFNEDCSDIVVLLLYNFAEMESYINPYITENLDVRTKCGTEWLSLKSSYFANIVEKRKVKAAMLNQVDIYETISYLEAQVDALTKLVKDAYDTNTVKTNDNTTSAYNVIVKANENSVMNIKSEEKLLKEMDYKAKIRTLQQEYYANKNSEE